METFHIRSLDKHIISFFMITFCANTVGLCSLRMESPHFAVLSSYYCGWNPQYQSPRKVERMDNIPTISFYQSTITTTRTRSQSQPGEKLRVASECTNLPNILPQPILALPQHPLNKQKEKQPYHYTEHKRHIRNNRPYI